MTGQKINNVFRSLFNKLWPRLLLGFFVPLILFLAASIVAFMAIQRLVVVLEWEQHSEVVLTKSFALQESVLAMTAAQRGHHLLGRDEFRRDFDGHRRDLLTSLEDLRTLVSDNAGQLERIREVKKLEAAWYEKARPSFALWQERPKFFIGEEFSRFVARLNMEQSVELLAKMEQTISGLIRTEVGILEKRRNEVRARTTESMWAIVLAIIVSAGFSLAISWLLAGSITRPIQRLGHAVANMRQGKFQSVTPHGPVEIADLVRGFNLMGIALAERTRLLESSELRYRTIVGATSNVLWTTDSQGNNTEMTSWCAFTGQHKDEASGDCWLNAVHPEDRELFVQRWQEGVGKRKHMEDEVRIRRCDGEYRHFNCRGVPVFDSAGGVVEWVRICIDITERRHEEQLLREKEAAEAANRAKSEFLAKMSHELRTPLNAVIGMSKMLTTQRFGVLNSKQLDYLSDITNAGEHLLGLINEILDLSRVEVGRIDLSIEALKVGDMVDNVVSTLRTLADNKRVQLTVVPLRPDQLIEADAARFKQILINLLSNAVKFTPSGGSVHVRCQWTASVEPLSAVVDAHDATAIRIDVEDTGIGIDPADHGKIGLEFFQANREVHRAQEGTGLGLALSRRLVELMGGKLWFSSEVGKGSVFSFALPRQVKLSEPNLRADQPVASVGANRREQPLVLIVDDYVATNKLFADWLDEAGLQTASAFDGKSGLEQARALKPQLILLDVRMPDLDGLDVLARLKSDPETAAIPVVIVSILENDPETRELDIVEWLIKPLDKETMLQRLRSLGVDKLMPAVAASSDVE